MHSPKLVLIKKTSKHLPFEFLATLYSIAGSAHCTTHLIVTDHIRLKDVKNESNFAKWHLSLYWGLNIFFEQQTSQLLPSEVRTGLDCLRKSFFYSPFPLVTQIVKSWSLFLCHFPLHGVINMFQMRRMNEICGDQFHDSLTGLMRRMTLATGAGTAVTSSSRRRDVNECLSFTQWKVAVFADFNDSGSEDRIETTTRTKAFLLQQVLWTFKSLYICWKISIGKSLTANNIISYLLNIFCAPCCCS